MAQANPAILIPRLIVAALVGGILGASFGIASAQDPASGMLDTACAGKCVANGYEGEFCDAVCWVPDPSKSAEADNLDWRCLEICMKQGGSARSCLPTCQRK